MTNLVNKDFTEIAADGHNYLLWAINIKIMLTTKGFIEDINKPNTSAHVLDTTKYITSRFLRHHFHQDLKIFEQDPCKF